MSRDRISRYVFNSSASSILANNLEEKIDENQNKFWLQVG